MRTIIPCFFKISQGMIYPTYDIIELPPMMFLLLSSLRFRRAAITILPEFTPNSVMLSKHADKGDEPWKIYSWCIRDVVHKYSGIDKLDEKLDLKDKMAFDALMNRRADRVEVNGQMFEYNGDEPVQEVRISSRHMLRRKSTVTYDLLEEDLESIKDELNF